MIKIVKASAGSGKTFSLAKQYISLLFNKKDRYAYRHILAVTFTNKATEEMKSRIVEELFRLANDTEKSAYCKDIIADPHNEIKTVSQLKKAAEDILCDILHDYSAFSVSTIDKFFQQTLRSFARELGQFNSYKIELDKKQLINEAIDKMLDSLSEDDKNLIKWMMDSAISSYEKGEEFRVDKPLYDMGNRLLSEEHRAIEKRRKTDEQFASWKDLDIYSTENLALIRKECNKIIKEFPEKVMAAAKAVGQALKDAQLTNTDFAQSFPKVILNYYTDLDGKKKIEKPTNSYLLQYGRDVESGFGIKVPKKGDRYDYIRRAQSALEEPLSAFFAVWEKPFKIYNSAKTIISQIYSLGVAGELEKSFNALMDEKNVKVIDDTNLILRDIISGSDVPFVYEKTGVRYENFLLDEFQDTSWVQWDNFYPLLKESEDNGQENFIVGDVKQSIYRFRDSDWQLLASEVGNKFQNSEATSLDTNYRSLSQIVNFNNEFFIEIAQRLDKQLKSENVKFEDLYEGVAQNVSPKSTKSADKGCVSFTFCPSSRTRVPDGEERVTQVDVLIKAIKEVIDSGKGQYSDIAILVRGIAEGLKVTNALIENNIPIITTDALEVKKSVLVGKLISLLYKVDEPENKIGGYWADQIGLEVPSDYSSLVDLCEELIRKLNEFYGSEYDGEVAYIQAFMDFVSTWAKDNDNDLHAFLKAWEEASVKICSPDGGDAIRLMTIHGSKGLDFPYVILPFAEKIELFKDNSERWCVPNQDYTDIPKAISQNIYNVKLSSKASPDSIFDDSFRIEYEKQVVDNFNILYVALTRASRAMYIIGEKPSNKNGAPETWPNFSNFSAALYYYLWNQYRTNSQVHIDDDNYRLGELPSFPHEQKEDAPQALECHYFSHPINDERGERLLLDRDDSEYFSEGSSARLEGIRLHKVMELVRLPEGLKGAVYQILARGDFSIEEANNAYKQLSKAIAMVHEQYGWFSKDSTILNETSIITSEEEQGKVYRPDRVEIHPDGSVVIIDYKFGRPNSSRHEAYLDQIRNYADLYRSMGHENVRAYLWYVAHNRVVEGK